jgi:hypothetical protein
VRPASDRRQRCEIVAEIHLRQTDRCNWDTSAADIYYCVAMESAAREKVTWLAL